jgi:nucleoside-diphosphate-sugar epimerase
MRILITGATGFIGSHIAEAVSRAGHELVLCARNPVIAQQRYPNAEILRVNFSSDIDTGIWLQRMKSIDVVINTVGIIREHRHQSFNTLHRDTPIALFRACEISHVKRVIQISALGADESAISHYHLSKQAADTVLSGLALDWAILMPSIVYGPNGKSMALFKALSSLPLIPLVESGDQPVQPLHINDLVSAVMHCIESDQAIRKRIELVGPEPITIKEIFSELRNWLGYPPAMFISLPYSAALRLAKWGGLLGCAPVDDEAMRMLRRGNTGDVKGFMEAFGYCPKAFNQALSELPAQQSDRWHAGLYFLHPLLRWSIAFVWLFTGIISLFLVPADVSFGMLEKTGINVTWAPLFLYGASLIDLLIGLAVLSRFYPSQIGWLQVLLILLYTLIITLSQPEHWMHPFGPVSKNAPLILSILILITLEKK